MTYYQIAYDLERQFATLKDAELANLPGTWVLPKIPQTVMTGEETATQRICVAANLNDCITAIRVCGPFKRCLAKNEDAKSYAEVLNEAYPIIIREFETDEIPVRPTTEQLPDVKETHELWLLKPTQIARSYTKWLDNYSIEFKSGPDGVPYGICTNIQFLDNPDKHDHPWLNGIGHILCSDMMDYEYEAYPTLKFAVSPEKRFTVKIQDNLRIPMPSEIIETCCLSAGNTIEVLQSGYEVDTEPWMSIVDARYQIAIPENIAKKYNLKDGKALAISKRMPNQIRVEPARNWIATTDKSGKTLCELQTDNMTVRIQCSCSEQTAAAEKQDIVYWTTLDTACGVQPSIHWKTIFHIQESEMPVKPTLEALQNMAVQNLRRLANEQQSDALAEYNRATKLKDLLESLL